MPRGFALYDAVQGYGYCVQIFESRYCGPKLLHEYSAGDSRHDSQVFGTGEADLGDLRIWAKHTARGMMDELGLEGRIILDTDILQDHREMLGQKRKGRPKRDKATV